MSQRPAPKRSLELRTRLKAKKPKFRRQESWRYKRVSQVWRKPDGIDSKMRAKKKGWPKSARIGYRGPRGTRYVHPSGFKEVLVRNVDDLAEADPQTQAVRIAHTVGLKKRADISVRAGEMGIRILNPLPEEKPTEVVRGAEVEEEAAGVKATEEETAEEKVESAEEGKKQKESKEGEGKS